METAVRTPLDIFNLPQHLVVPYFQRPYVWGEEDQWAPLWHDIRRIAELKVVDPASSATHFLGAVVLQAQENTTGTIQPRLIIDGQQRLTTLQVLMDATASILSSLTYTNLALRLEELTHNPPHYVQEPGDRLKLRHTNRDRSGFEEVMHAPPPVDYGGLVSAGTLITKAHRFFSLNVADWLDGLANPAIGADALTAVVTRALQLVVIDLRADEDSQEIFETLNARGTPLTAADLIKNYVFQKLAAEGVDTKSAYSEHWPFDSGFWEKEVSVGRYSVSRSSLFLVQWLTARVGEEISPRNTFARFKHYAEHESNRPMSQLLPLIKAQAAIYQSWTERAADKNAALNPVEMCVYRMAASDLELLKPILVWLHEPDRAYDQEAITGVIKSTESWVFRRALLRLTTSDLGRPIADLIRTHRDVPGDQLAESVEKFLTSLDAASTYWPGDAEIKRSMLEEQVYQRFKKARLRMLLEAAEDYFRGFTAPKAPASSRVERGVYPIEHLMPQRWEEHWPTDPLKENDRREHIHRLGNLTLLTSTLNAKISNSPWLGTAGKRTMLRAHDVFLMNRRIEDISSGGWDETLIDARSDELVEALLATWPVPEKHLGVVRDLKGRRDFTVSLKQLAASGLLVPGTVLQSASKKWTGCTALVADDGSLLVGADSFPSPSPAAMVFTNVPTNGWVFWALPDGRLLGDLRELM